MYKDENVIYSRGLENGFVMCHGDQLNLGFALQMKSEKDLKILEENIDGCTKVHEIPGIEGSLCEVKKCHLLIQYAVF